MTTPIVARDLAKIAPHSPRERLAGFVIARRAIDKCCASLAGTAGDYHYDCPLDNLLFSFKGINAGQFKAAVQAAKNYEDVGAWLEANGTRKTAVEIKAWSDEVEASSPIKNPEKRDYFIENCSKLMLNPQTNTTFDWLEADDRATVRRGAASAKAPVTQPVETMETRVFPQAMHQLRPNTQGKPSFAGRKSKKNGNNFSKSRDNREDRGMRQMKTARSAQSSSRGR